VKPHLVALHGFLGEGSDWDAVRAASKADVAWSCPDLFRRADAIFDLPAPDGPCWLAGYSFGARLALSWMQRDPARWRGALLLSVNPGNFQTDEERIARRQADQTWAAAFAGQPWTDVLARWHGQPVLAASPAPRRKECDFSRRALAGVLRDFSTADQFTDPLRLPARLTWMAGGRDAKFSALQTSMREAGFPGTFLVVDQAGHRLLEEAPDAVAAALDDLVA
jgi:2-succinyl-6-hydroxy-2,4-cyclohexadiene-1-carboxylate synthase